MNSRIFYISKNINDVKEKGNLKKEMFEDGGDYEYFLHTTADCVYDIEESDIDLNITWMQEMFKEDVEVGYEDGYRFIKFLPGFKVKYMTKILNDIKEIVNKLTVEDLIDPMGLTLYSLQKTIDDKFTFHFLLEEWGLANQDCFIRFIEEDTEYYIGREILAYHY